VVVDTHLEILSQILTLAITLPLADRLALAETVETTDYLERVLLKMVKQVAEAAVVPPVCGARG
jgi:hypothetical protein